MNVMDVYRSVVTGRRVVYPPRREECNTPCCTCLICARATHLLHGFLSHEQRSQLLHKGYFDVTVKSGHVYRIYANVSYNVHRLHHGSTVARYCLIAGMGVPPGDELLSQKLLLEADEGRFLALANRGEL